MESTESVINLLQVGSSVEFQVGHPGLTWSIPRPVYYSKGLVLCDLEVVDGSLAGMDGGRIPGFQDWADEGLV